MDVSTRRFQQSLCESRSILENLDPASARLVNELQKQVTKLKSDIEAEKRKCRNLAQDHLVELKRLREEQERRLNSCLDAMNQRKNNEKAMEIKKLEEQWQRTKESEIKALQRAKLDELRSLEQQLQAQFDGKLRYSIEQERRLAFDEAQAQLPSEDELVARETKLAKEVFSLGGENSRLEDQVRNLVQENRSQIELIRQMKREHELEIENILKKNKTEAARDNARLKLGEQIILERESEVLGVLQRAEAAEIECDKLRTEVELLKASLEAANRSKENDFTSQSARRSGSVFKQIEELEYSLKKAEEEKSKLKQENASLRKKSTTLDVSDSKSNKETEEKLKVLRKRNADLVNLTKTLDERCKSLKQENSKLQEKRTSDSGEIEQQIRKSLSRQHAKDVSDYTRKIASRDREIMELKRKLSKYEVSIASNSGRQESVVESSKRMKTMAMEHLRMEKLVSKLYSHLPNDTDVEFTCKDFSSEAARLQELSEENESLRMQVHELQQPSEVDGTRLRKTETPSELEAVREMREENHRLLSKFDEFAKLEKLNEELNNELSDTKLALSSSEKKMKLLEEDLEQAHVIAQEYERNQEHIVELEKEISETRGQLNERDTEICHLQLQNKTSAACVIEKEEEIESLKETISSLKNELMQGEQLVNELKSELETAVQQPDVTTTSMQTSPLFSPKKSPKSSQTSPLSSPKDSPKAIPYKILECLPEDKGGDEFHPRSSVISISKTSLDNNKSKSFVQPPSDLHSEMEAAGVLIPDPYDSEGPLMSDDNISEPASSGVSVDRADTPINKSSSQLNLSDTDSVSLFIACEDYLPSIMSPNPDSDIELHLKRGDYIYVLGEIDDDGFYNAQSADGKKGLVPSNYVRKLTDTVDISPVQSNESLLAIPPPINLELTRQFVSDNAYCLAIYWEPPKSLPPNMTGYNVYVNNQFESAVEIGDETSILLSDIPRNQFICVSVRTATSEGESCDPAKVIEINPQYPEAPCHLSLQLITVQPLLFRLSWSLMSASSKRLSLSSLAYKVYLNQSLLLKSVPLDQLGHTPSAGFFIDLEIDDFKSITLENSVFPVNLSIQAVSEQYASPMSTAIPIPNDILRVVYPDISISDDMQSTQSMTTMSNGPSELTATSEGSQSSVDAVEVSEVIIGNYYRCLYSYDPAVSSPNENGASEELAFVKNDIVEALGELDEDGFFMGSCCGNKGLVPKNMIELVTDIDDATVKLAQKHNRSINHVANGNHIDGSGQKLVQALYDYDPLIQSPNDSPSDELSFHRGDYITVFGEPDESGFYEGELKGQKGLIPKGFVTPVSSSALISSLNNKTTIHPSAVET